MQRMIIKDNKKGKASWWKHITKIDDKSKNGYAFVGSFIKPNQEIDIPDGALVMNVRWEGEPGGRNQFAILYQVDNGDLVEKAKFDWKTEKLSVIDKAKELLGEVPNPLASFTDAQLVLELIRRGFRLPDPEV